MQSDWKDGKGRFRIHHLFDGMCLDTFLLVSYVGRTHTIVRLQKRIRRKDGTENFGGFVYVLDGFLQRDFLSWVFMCLINFSLSIPATTLRATTPHRYRTGYHAFTTTARLSRLCIYIPAITP